VITDKAKPIKIAIDARTLCQKQRGMPTYVSHICKLLPQKMPNVQFKILVNTRQEYNESSLSYADRIEQCVFDNTEIVDLQSSTVIRWEQVLLPAYLRDVGIDLLHMPCNRGCLNTNIKQIITFHDLMEWDSLDFKGSLVGLLVNQNFYRFKVTVYKWLIYRVGMSKADHILSISKYSLSSIHNAFPSTVKKSSFVYHGVPEEYSIQKEIVPLEERKHIFMLGGESHQKNALNMIEAYSRLTPEVTAKFPLIIAGIADLENSIICEKIKELGIDNLVQCYGWIDSTVILSLFRQARLFLFVSREEGFGFPLLQSMTIGTPVVTSTTEVLVELGQHNVLKSNSEDVGSITNNIQQLLSDDALWNLLSQNAASAAKTYSWHNTIKHIENIYKNTLGIDS
jgi:glycosyltransferase involved in cell wall biosynthesis